MQNAVTQQHTLFITCAKGVEDLLQRECEQQGITDPVAQTGGVTCKASLQQAYAICLWSRVGSRVLLKFAQFAVSDYDELYRRIGDIDWSQHMDARNTLAIDCFSNDAALNNSHFAMLKIKDAIVDQLRQADGLRPDIVKQQPDIRINVYIHQGEAIVYLDLSGEALHRRGYRQSTGSAPLRETLAAAMLYRAKWPQLAEQGKPLVDCMCGSGTLLIEAAMIAAKQPPAWRRDNFGFSAWKQHDENAWQSCLQAAKAGIKPHDALPSICGYDISDRALQLATQHVAAAGFADCISLQRADCTQALPALPETPGLLITNPPYGKRLGEIEQLKDLYFKLGQQLKTGFAGWDAAVFTPIKELAQCIGLRSHHKNTLYNGALKCTLYQYRIRQSTDKPVVDAAKKPEHAQAFANRLAKNLKHLKKWARKNSISCYRVYDADIPQYAVAVDIYDDEALIYEYQAPKAIHAGKALQRLNDVIEVVQQTLQLPRDKIVVKTRKKQSGREQYTPLDNTRHFKTVSENGLKFLVNLHDYLDTGLFLDHRITRQMLREMANNRHVLNLFAYTGSFTVYAAAAGARSTTTVDMSNTYLQWAKRNLAANNLLADKHQFVHADCLQWVKQQRGKKSYDLIVLDPPTFSNSKRMDNVFDIQRDHVALLQDCMALLSEQGTLFFSTNAKRFRLDDSIMESFAVKDITAQTLSEDFKRKPAHKCWLVRYQ